jgi:hypothetical protein
MFKTIGNSLVAFSLSASFACNAASIPNGNYAGSAAHGTETGQLVSPDSDILNDASALAAKYKKQATSSCRNGADQYLEGVVRRTYLWTDNPVFIKFDADKVKVAQPGVLKMITRDLLVKNDIGAWQRSTLDCEYDTQRNLVVMYHSE